MDQNTSDKPTDEKKETTVANSPEPKIEPAPAETTKAPETTEQQSPQFPTETPISSSAPVENPTPPLQTETSDQSMSSNIQNDGGYTETKSNKLLYVLVFILVVILLSLAGLFLYKQFLTNTTTTAQPVVETTPAENPTITPGSANQEEAEVQNIEVPDIDKELQDINLDVEQL